MGRTPKSDELREAQGNPGRRPIGSGDPVQDTLPGFSEDAPPELNEAGQRIWQELVPLLQQLRFIRRTDKAVLPRYCNALARYWELEAQIRQRGPTYETESRHGRMERINPALRAQDLIDRRLESMEDRLGLNPRARQQIIQALANSAVGSLPLDATTTSDTPKRSPVGMLAGDAAETRH